MSIDPGIAIVLAAVSLAMGWVYNTHKSPKEYSSDIYKVLADALAALANRVGNVEVAHAGLALKYAESHGRLDESVDNLEKGVHDLKGAIEKLTARLEQFAPNSGKGHARRQAGTT